MVIEEGARRLRQSTAYTAGLVELQDGASQAVVEALPLAPGTRVLDYCAGGGGKSLALAAHPGVDVCAHDISEARLGDLLPRAERAGTPVTLLATKAQMNRQAPFDIVLCDVPCSGSGSWRRAPDAKWRLDEARLRELSDVQSGILEEAAALVAPDGLLAYATCSVLRVENEAVIERFRAAHPEWKIAFRRGWTLQDGTDGFFATHLKRG
jgi:16S rRNA (cytosine967-C5)-methyltransferase